MCILHEGKYIVWTSWGNPGAARYGAGIGVRPISNISSLKRGAVQLLYVTRVKTELEDKTINISTLILNAPNADFDKLPCAA